MNKITDLCFITIDNIRLPCFLIGKNKVFIPAKWVTENQYRKLSLDPHEPRRGLIYAGPDLKIDVLKEVTFTQSTSKLTIDDDELEKWEWPTSLITEKLYIDGQIVGRVEFWV